MLSTRCLALMHLALVFAWLTPGAAQAQPDATPRNDTQKLTVILLGTGAGPLINLERYGASTLIIAGDEVLLFDCGRGATFRLQETGISLGRVDKLFLTHLHSDHVVQLPDLLLTPWAFARSSGGPRKLPLRVWGPAGTRDMMDHMQQAFAYDIHVRRDIDERFSAEGIKVVSRDIEQGTVYENNGVKVTAFLVDHGPVKPAFGYRVDYRGRSVALSGDTRFSENLIRFSKGADVLIHEVVDPEIWAQARKTKEGQAFADKIIAHHVSPEQAGEVFSRVKPRLAVYSHAAYTPQLIPKTRKTYAGPLELGEDLMTIEIGEKVEVRRHTR